MNDDICDFYLQVSKELCEGKEWCWTGIGEPLRRFAALVAANERDALRVRVKELEGELAAAQDKINPPRAHYERP